MSVDFEFRPYDPCPPSAQSLLGDAASNQGALLALDIQAKYLFVDEEGNHYHSYALPSDADIHNVGGYVDKVIQYRAPALLEHFRANGVRPEALETSRFLLLASRSPRLDLQIFSLIQRLRAGRSAGERVSLFDLGCTVAEHWTFLDTLLRANADESAADVLSYTGLDKSSLLLTVARLLHMNAEPAHFRLVHSEGSAFEFPERSFDLALSVGVPNHVHDPLAALEKMLRAVRHAAVMALWSTSESVGFWTTIHSGLAFYFFSHDDLKALEARLGRGRFFVLDFVPEQDNSQERSYVGLSTDKIESLGCHHLLYSCLDHPELTPL